MSLSRILSRSLSRSVSRGLTAGGASLDPDAAAYIAAVEAAGATVTESQRTIINDWYVAAKADYYTSFKRIYFPIWGVAAANAISMIGLTSGTFVGGVTHAAGYIQGDGTTGHLRTLVSPSALGLTTSSASIGILVNQAESRILSVALMGSSASLSSGGATRFLHTAISPVSANLAGTGSVSSASTDGIFIANRTETNALTMNTRRTSGFAEVSSTSAASSVTTINSAVLARFSGSATVTGYTNARVGLAFYGTEFALGKPETVTLHFKTLWEGCTGLTLP